MKRYKEYETAMCMIEREGERERSLSENKTPRFALMSCLSVLSGKCLTVPFVRPGEPGGREGEGKDEMEVRGKGKVEQRERVGGREGERTKELNGNEKKTKTVLLLNISIIRRQLNS